MMIIMWHLERRARRTSTECVNLSVNIHTYGFPLNLQTHSLRCLLLIIVLKNTVHYLFRTGFSFLRIIRETKYLWYAALLWSLSSGWSQAGNVFIYERTHWKSDYSMAPSYRKWVNHVSSQCWESRSITIIWSCIKFLHIFWDSETKWKAALVFEGIWGPVQSFQFFLYQLFLSAFLSF